MLAASEREWKAGLLGRVGQSPSLLGESPTISICCLPFAAESQKVLLRNRAFVAEMEQA
jgi:hypothetical protein